MKTILSLLILPLFLAGCIGTDFLEETANLAEPRIDIFPEVSAIQVGEALQFEAMYYDSTESLVSTSFTWQSTDDLIAQINESGDVTGLAAGQVRITASAFGVSSERALLTVVSDASQVAFVEIMPMDTSTVVKQTVQFTAVTLNADRTALAERPITWQTSNDSLATIRDDGLVVTREPGVVQIIATSEGVESSPINLEIFAESRTGAFSAAAGTSYTVKGNATLEQIPGGMLQLSFSSNFQSSNGPDLNVYLSTVNGINASSVKLGQLQSTRGEQTYEIPNFVEMNDFDYVVIHCLPFNVTFGSARLG